MRSYSFILAAIIASTITTTLSAQSPGERKDSVLSVSLALVQSRPHGDFGRNTGIGYGISGALQLRLDRAGILSIRADLAGLQYGDEKRRSMLSEQVGGRILVDVNTTNYFVPFSIGTQLTYPRGPVRPYLSAGIGGVAFYTESTVGGTADGFTFASTVNQSDFSTQWTAGSGVYIKLSNKRVPLMLDLGVQYMNGGRASYLAPGSIIDLPDGEIQITPLQSRAETMLVRLGVRWGR